MAKKNFILSWWDDKTESSAKEGCLTYERALIRKAQIEFKTGNRVRLEVKT